MLWSRVYEDHETPKNWSRVGTMNQFMKRSLEYYSTLYCISLSYVQEVLFSYNSLRTVNPCLTLRMQRGRNEKLVNPRSQFSLELPILKNLGSSGDQNVKNESVKD